MDHFMGSHGGRVLPLYRDPEATIANIAPRLAEVLNYDAKTLTPNDLVAYCAAITAHPGYVARFEDDLRRSPGVRLPITRDAGLWNTAVEIGREVIWLHTFGERFVDRKAGRPPGAPRMRDRRPKVLVGISDGSDEMPNDIDYDPQTEELHIGTGRIAPVSPTVWEYEVAGRRVVKKWFEYRKREPSGRRSSPLDFVNATFWSADMTTELLELLNVLGRCVGLERRQADVLDEILAGPLVTLKDLEEARVLPVPSYCRKPPKSFEGRTLWRE
jgi:hypothetical protein